MKHAHTKHHLSFHSFSLSFTPFHSLILISLLFVSCEKENNGNDTPNPEGTVSALILNEGSWGSNNSSLTAIDIEEGEVVSADWFSSKNGRGLGDVVQDMLQYGSKIYVTVTFSNSLEVIDAKSGTSQRVDMGNRKPRYIAADGGKLYITCYNPCSVVRVDTATLAIEATCPLGSFQPEGIAISRGKAFVASSNISDAAGNYSYDNKLYVVDLATFANPTTVTVGCNPQEPMVLTDGKIIVNCWGDYGTQPAGTAIVDVNSLDVTQTGQALTKMSVYGGKAYGYATTYDASYNQTVNYVGINSDGTVADFPFTFSVSGNPYGITLNPTNGDIYVMTDGNYTANGTVYCFTQSGDLRFMLEAGMLPKKVVFTE
jgi:hypothetical protein